MREGGRQEKGSDKGTSLASSRVEDSLQTVRLVVDTRLSSVIKDETFFDFFEQVLVEMEGRERKKEEKERDVG